MVFPPPNFVLNPKQNMTSGVVLYILANFSRTSVLATVALPGCKTSTIWNLKCDNWRNFVLNFELVCCCSQTWNKTAGWKNYVHNILQNFFYWLYMWKDSKYWLLGRPKYWFNPWWNYSGTYWLNVFWNGVCIIPSGYTLSKITKV